MRQTSQHGGMFMTDYRNNCRFKRFIKPFFIHESSHSKRHVHARTLLFSILLSLFVSQSTACSLFPSAENEFSGSKALTVSASGHGKRHTVESILKPQAPGAMTAANSDGSITLDYSNTADGYIMIRDTHDTTTQIQITGPDGVTYPFPLNSHDFTAFPLSHGNGHYEVSVLEQISGSNYAVSLSQGFDVSLKDEFGPYLYPNQYVKYTDSSNAVLLGRKLSARSDSDLSYINNVYNYILKHVKYDDVQAASIQPNYIPDADTTLRTGKGICFDYAVLMTAMLRSQNIPTRLEVGYVGKVYHAWISVYTKDKGWINNTIYFDGKNWSLMDPTLAANNSNAAIRKFTGDGSNYVVRYLY